MKCAFASRRLRVVIRLCAWGLYQSFCFRSVSQYRDPIQRLFRPLRFESHLRCSLTELLSVPPESNLASVLSRCLTPILFLFVSAGCSIQPVRFAMAIQCLPRKNRSPSSFHGGVNTRFHRCKNCVGTGTVNAACPYYRTAEHEGICPYNSAALEVK